MKVYKTSNVSIIMPAWKAREEIVEAIKSTLNQTVLPKEIIVVTDTDSDKYTEWFNNIDSKLIKHIKLDKEHHPSEKANIAFKESTGDYITFLSDDDLLDEHFIEKMSNKMSEGFDVVYSDMEVFGTRNYICEASNDWSYSQFCISTVPYITSMVTREMFNKVGGYSKDTMYYDWDFWFTCFELGAKAFHLKEPLFKYRSTDGNQTSFVQNPDYRTIVINKHKQNEK